MEQIVQRREEGGVIPIPEWALDLQGGVGEPRAQGADQHLQGKVALTYLTTFQSVKIFRQRFMVLSLDWRWRRSLAFPKDTPAEFGEGKFYLFVMVLLDSS